jgi:hypothetical protein
MENVQHNSVLLNYDVARRRGADLKRYTKWATFLYSHRGLRTADRVSVHALVRLFDFANCNRMEMTTRVKYEKGVK